MRTAGTINNTTKNDLDLEPVTLLVARFGCGVPLSNWGSVEGVDFFEGRYTIEGNLRSLPLPLSISRLLQGQQILWLHNPTMMPCAVATSQEATGQLQTKMSEM